MSWFEELDTTGATGLLGEGPLAHLLVGVCYLAGPRSTGLQHHSPISLVTAGPQAYKVLILSPEHMLPGGCLLAEQDTWVLPAWRHCPAGVAGYTGQASVSTQTCFLVSLS